MNFLVSILLLAFFHTSQSAQPDIYSFKVPALDGSTIDFSQFKGKKILIVNVASECGYTPQYTDLEKLYNKYHDKLVIVGFPANNFLGQEPGSNEEIRQFCSSKYQITFPMAEKISVKGKNMAPIYAWLTQKSLNGVEDSEVSWNFNKYLLNEKGEYVAHFNSKTEPLGNKITEAIEKQ